MEIDHLPETDGVVRFPVERRAKPTLMLAEELAPRSDLTDVMADELAGDEGRPDTLAETVEAFTRLADTMAFSMGVDAAVAHLRAMNAVPVERACALGWAYRDAEAAAEQAQERFRNAKAAGSEWLLDGLDEQVCRTRSEWTARALAARAATDAARGAREALDCFERGEPWRRMTGEEGGLLLVELQEALNARRRERAREDEPV